MAQPVTIDNPILHSPSLEPTRHFRFDDREQITGEVRDGRRASTYRVPAVAAARRSVRPTLFDEDPGGREEGRGPSPQ